MKKYEKFGLVAFIGGAFIAGFGSKIYCGLKKRKKIQEDIKTEIDNNIAETDKNITETKETQKNIEETLKDISNLETLRKEREKEHEEKMKELEEKRRVNLERIHQYDLRRQERFKNVKTVKEEIDALEADCNDLHSLCNEVCRDIYGRNMGGSKIVFKGKLAEMMKEKIKED